MPVITDSILNFFGISLGILYVAFWVGVLLLAIYWIVHSRPGRDRIYLIWGLVLTLGSIFLSTVFWSLLVRALTRG